MTITLRKLERHFEAEIVPLNGTASLNCWAKIYLQQDGRYSIDYSHRPRQIGGAKGWAIDNLTWALSLEDAEHSVEELFGVLEQCSQVEIWST